MKNHFIKIASLAFTTILSYSTIDLNSAQAANHFSEFFLTAQTTQSTLKIEPTAVIDDVIKPNSKAIASSIAVAQLINIWLEKTNLEYKFLNAKSQTKASNRYARRYHPTKSVSTIHRTRQLKKIPMGGYIIGMH